MSLLLEWRNYVCLLTIILIEKFVFCAQHRQYMAARSVGFFRSLFRDATSITLHVFCDRGDLTGLGFGQDKSTCGSIGFCMTLIVLFALCLPWHFSFLTKPSMFSCRSTDDRNETLRAYRIIWCPRCRYGSTFSIYTVRRSRLSRSSLSQAPNASPQVCGWIALEVLKSRWIVRMRFVSRQMSSRHQTPGVRRERLWQVLDRQPVPSRSDIEDERARR